MKERMNPPDHRQTDTRARPVDRPAQPTDAWRRGVLKPLARAIGRQQGYILPWSIIASVLGIFVVLPVAVLVATQFRGQGKLEDSTRDVYATDAAVHAVIEDLARGADADPVSPNTYTLPTVDFGDVEPSVLVNQLVSQTMSTERLLDYAVSGSPTVLSGTGATGGATELADDDNSYYKLTASGSPPSLSYEVISEEIDFSSVSLGEITVTASATAAATRLDLYVHNPDDAAHTNGGYDTTPDVAELLDVADTEETVSFRLVDADVTYVNSLSTKTLKIKVVASNNTGFRLDTDRVVFTIGGPATTDLRYVTSDPTINAGTLVEGTLRDMEIDDTTNYKIKSVGNVVEFDVTSDDLALSSVDAVTVPLLVQTNKKDVVLEMYVYNSDDDAHTNGGYNTTPDLTATLAFADFDRWVSLEIPKADVAYLNTLSPISVKVKIRATHTTSFQLRTDLLLFSATSLTSQSQSYRGVTHQYVDPGLRNPDMATVAVGEGYLLRMYNVGPGLLNVNWASHTPSYADGQTSVQVYRGQVSPNPPREGVWLAS